MQENLKEKYGITDEELKRAVDQINLGKIACDGIVLVALVDLITSGDIKSNKPDELPKDVADYITADRNCYELNSDCRKCPFGKEGDCQGKLKQEVNKLYNKYIKKTENGV